jgi:hypothetical protein
MLVDALRAPSVPRFRDAVTHGYESAGDSVSSPSRFLPTPEQVRVGTGIARIVIGATFLAAPALSVRILGVDSATAKRMRFLARMAAARDIGLGCGTLDAGPGVTAAPWLLAGAAAAAADAVAIAGALRTGTARGLPAAGIAAGAAASAVLGVWAAATTRCTD